MQPSDLRETEKSLRDVPLFSKRPRPNHAVEQVSTDLMAARTAPPIFDWRDDASRDRPALMIVVATIVNIGQALHFAVEFLAHI